MATDVISNLSGSLDAELEKARETLRSVDDNIKKVFGKDASELTVFGRYESWCILKWRVTKSHKVS